MFMMKLLIQSQIVTASPLKFGKELVIPSRILQKMVFLFHAGIKVNPC